MQMKISDSAIEKEFVDVKADKLELSSFNPRQVRNIDEVKKLAERPFIIVPVIYLWLKQKINRR